MKRLKKILKKKSGRSKGKVTVRHQGGRSKRFLRIIDFKRSKKDVWARVENIEYDPNRDAKIAKVVYEDGVRAYMIAPDNLKTGMKIISSDNAPIEIGNCLPLAKIPVGQAVHNIEIRPGRGAQVARGAGISAFIFGREDSGVLVKMPSGEIKKFNPLSRAVIGQVSNVDHKNKKLRKAGQNRWKGKRPTVRGVAMHPDAHPHGGGEGRSGIGLKYPKTPWGKKAVGKTRIPDKYSDKLVVQSRQKRKRV